MFKKKAKDYNTVAIAIDPNKYYDAAGADILLALLESNKSIESNEDNCQDELFIENTDIFFSTIEAFGNNDQYKDLYHNFDSSLAERDHLTICCKYITQKFNDNSQIWLSKNEQRLHDFDSWLQEN